MGCLRWNIAMFSLVCMVSSPVYCQDTLPKFGTLAEFQASPYYKVLSAYEAELQGSRIEVQWNMKEEGLMVFRWPLNSTLKNEQQESSGWAMVSSELGHRVRAKIDSGQLDMLIDFTNNPIQATNLFVPMNEVEAKEKSREMNQAAISHNIIPMGAMEDCFWPAWVLYQTKYYPFMYSVGEITAQEDGRSKVDLRFFHDSFTIVFDDTDGFQIHSVTRESFNPKFPEKMRQHTWKYINQKFGKTWMPIDCQMELLDRVVDSYDGKAKEGQLNSHWTGQPKIVPEITASIVPWYINFPAGTHLSNDITREHIVVEEAGTVIEGNAESRAQALEDIATAPTQGAYKSRLPQTVFWSLLGLVAIIAVSFCFYKWRYGNLES